MANAFRGSSGSQPQESTSRDVVHLARSMSASKDQVFEELKEFFISEFRFRGPKRRIIHDVIPVQNIGGREELLARIDREAFTGSFFTAAIHDDHVHIIHDCSYDGSWCRCNRIRQFRQGQRFPRRVYWTSEVTPEHFANLLIYLSKDGRQIVSLQISSREWYQDFEARYVRSGSLCEYGRDAEMEGSGAESYDGLFSLEPDGSAFGGPSGGDSEVLRQKTKGKGRKRKKTEREKLLDFFKSHLAAPLLNIKNTSYFMKSMLMFSSKSDVETCVQMIAVELNECNTQEIYEYINNARVCIFNAPNGHTNDYYYSVEQSVDILNTILDFQCGSIDAKKEFIKNLFYLCDKLIPKKNYFMVIGPPMSGKNYFFDCVIHYYLSFGQIGNFNKYVSFPMQEAVNKRILLWNEPNFSPEFMDTLKMLLGGDTLNVKVKYQADAVVPKTPVIILSNKSVLPNTVVWQSRGFTYRWSYMAQLKMLKKKPHPLAWYYLLVGNNFINDDDRVSDNESSSSSFSVLSYESCEMEEESDV